MENLCSSFSSSVSYTHWKQVGTCIPIPPYRKLCQLLPRSVVYKMSLYFPTGIWKRNVSRTCFPSALKQPFNMLLSSVQHKINMHLKAPLVSTAILLGKRGTKIPKRFVRSRTEIAPSSTAGGVNAGWTHWHWHGGCEWVWEDAPARGEKPIAVSLISHQCDREQVQHGGMNKKSWLENLKGRIIQWLWFFILSSLH